MTNSIVSSNLINSQSDFVQYIQDNSIGGRNLSIRGLAGLCGVAESSVREGAGLDSTKLAQKLAESGFEGARLIGAGFCAQSAWLVIEYFAYESKAKAEGAKRLARLFGSIGVQTCFDTAYVREVPRQLPPMRDALEYVQALPIVNGLSNTRLKELLLNKMTDELTLHESQKQLPTKTTRYTIAKVRATELGYSLSQIGSGSALGTHIGKQVDRIALGAFQDDIGNYSPWHYPVCIDLDMAIHSYFRIKGLDPENEPKALCDYR
jgi:hypothetical protein